MNVGKNWGRDSPIPLISTLWLNSDSWSVECLPFFKKKTHTTRGRLGSCKCYQESHLLLHVTVRAVSSEWSQTLPILRRHEIYHWKYGTGLSATEPAIGPPWLCAWLRSACGQQAVSSDRASVHLGKFHCGCFPVSPEECRGWPSGRLNE